MSTSTDCTTFRSSTSRATGLVSASRCDGSLASRVCRERPAGLRLYCLSPDPATTRGEARQFAELAEREGWQSLVLVTSNYHVRRAGLLLDRCYGGQVRRVATPLFNLAHGPAVSVPWPNGQGLPIGIQVAAAPGRDALVLRVAREIERLADRRPAPLVLPRSPS